ncbi:hypothetical protein EST38_g5883 [Candolleomyces aberdarensis]|uniref:Uncharacterized protein n=1 Tax=Candolleomyces aberdarensis TaxID=2316362 RepID=A0A4V1Q3W2_9AGAR|nr:hypothetical protein EST38_g5883 [Candolleomyces aberdarensis]
MPLLKPLPRKRTTGIFVHINITWTLEQAAMGGKVLGGDEGHRGHDESTRMWQ